MTQEAIPGQDGATAWIIESAKAGAAPYLTVKPEVAIKRKLAGDHVTPYHSKHAQPDDEEL